MAKNVVHLVSIINVTQQVDTDFRLFGLLLWKVDIVFGIKPVDVEFLV